VAVSLVKWESRADPFPGDARTGSVLQLTRVTAWHGCFDDEDTGGRPAGQQQARCLRDFPGHVASRVDAIFPERPCGRVLGAASSNRNVRNRRGDCGAVCRLPATRCFGGRLTHGHHSGGGLSSGTFARRRRESRGRYCCPTHCPGACVLDANACQRLHGGLHLRVSTCGVDACVLSALRLRPLQLAGLFRGGEKSQRAHLASSACAMSSGSRVIFSRVQLFVCD
jgi:hypothetical protein